jgi:hypothetical protein
VRGLQWIHKHALTEIHATKAVKIFGSNHGAVFAADFARVTVSDSDASENSVGFVAQANGGDVIINIANSTAGNNTMTGIQAGDTGAASVVRFSDVSILSNAVNGLVVGTNVATGIESTHCPAILRSPEFLRPRKSGTTPPRQIQRNDTTLRRIARQ